MKKVCVLHHTKYLGGGTKSFIDLLNMLKETYDVIACIPKGANEIVDLLQENAINYYEVSSVIPLFPYYSGSSSLISKSLVKTIYRLKDQQGFVDEINALNPSVLIFNSIVTTISAGRLDPQIKKICFVRETFKRTFVDNIFKKILERYFVGVAFIAEAERRYLNLTNVITEVIPDSYPSKDISIITKEEACEIENIQNDTFNILFLGGVDYIKGLDVILKAMSLLDERFILIIAGQFEKKQLEIREIIKKYSSPRLMINRLKIRKYYQKIYDENKIKCVGFKNNISTIMCASDVVVFPSNRAHQPRPGIEAGEYMKTIILSDFKATEEYFVNGYNSLVFKPRDSNDLAKKICFLEANPDQRKKMEFNNNFMSHKKHNYVEISKRMREFLQKCIDVNYD